MSLMFGSTPGILLMRYIMLNTTATVVHLYAIYIMPIKFVNLYANYKYENATNHLL